MAAAVKRTDPGPSLTSRVPTPENQIDGVVSPLETTPIDYADACKLVATGFRKASGSDKVVGFAANRQNPGYPITVYKRVAFGYLVEEGSGSLPMGTLLYLSTSVAGGLDTTPNGNPVAIWTVSALFTLKATGSAQ